jgi:hypothetical protein
MWVKQAVIHRKKRTSERQKKLSTVSRSTSISCTPVMKEPKAMFLNKEIELSTKNDQLY